MLSQTKEKVGIIVVAGKYRTGKSFLLNRIILDKKQRQGFGVGPTINPHTKVRIFILTKIYRGCKYGTDP